MTTPVNLEQKLAQYSRTAIMRGAEWLIRHAITDYERSENVDLALDCARILETAEKRRIKLEKSC